MYMKNIFLLGLIFSVAACSPVTAQEAPQESTQANLKRIPIVTDVRNGADGIQHENVVITPLVDEDTNTIIWSSEDFEKMGINTKIESGNSIQIEYYTQVKKAEKIKEQ